MDIALIIIAIILSVVGVIGSIVPALPGPPINYIALLLIQWAFQPYSVATLVTIGVFTVIILALDYLIPIWTAKKYGATKQGITGSIIGMLIGILFTPIGMIFGTLVGAIIGDLIAGKTTQQATRSGAAILFGTVLSIGFKFILSITMSLLVVYEVFNYFINKHH